MSLDIEGVHSLETRWIFSGRPVTGMAAWFGRFPAQTVVLEDAYLVDPHTPGLSVKVRERRALEVKAYHGSPGLLEIPGQARGHLEAWQKWSFPFDPVSQRGGDPAGWRTVRKRRRICRFSRGNGPAGVRFPGPGEKPGCVVELAEFRALGEDWWTLGFESTGTPSELREQIEATAVVVFGQALPAGIELGIDDSMPYARWLRGQADTRYNRGA